MQIFLKNLVFAVGRAASIVDSRPALSKHSLLGLRAGGGSLSVFSTSSTSAMEVSVPCQGDLNETLVDCKLLHTMLTRIWGETITLELDGEQLVVRGEFGEAKLATSSAEDFVSLDWLETEDTVDLPNLQDCGKQILFSVADPTRIVLHGAHFLFANNQLRLATSDGYRITTKTVPIESDFQASFVVVPEAAEQIFALSPGKLSIKNSLVQIENQNTKFLTRLVDGQYPDIDKLLAQQNQSSCVFQRNNMLQAIKAASVFFDKPKIKLEFRDKILIFSEDKEQSKGRCQVQVEYQSLSGDAPSFCCNPNFLLDWLKAAKDDVIEMQWLAHNRAIFLKQGSNLGMFMPMLER